jgi:hypothetical protein
MLEDRRSFFRFNAIVPISFADPDNGLKGEGETHDISAKGIGFFTENEIVPRTTLDIWLKVPDRDEGIYAKGAVIWSRQVEPDRYRVGVELEKVDFISLSHVLHLA